MSLTGDEHVSETLLRQASDKERLAKIIPVKKKREFIFRRTALNYVLSQYLENYNIVSNEDEKPKLVTGNACQHIGFSLSASKNYCSIAVSSNDIGIDIEAIDTQVDITGICERFIPHFDHMLDQLSLCGADTRAYSTIWWCKLEAFTKLYGFGLDKVIHDAKRMKEFVMRKYSHERIVSTEKYVCAVSKKHEFTIDNIYKIPFERVLYAS